MLVNEIVKLWSLADTIDHETFSFVPNDLVNETTQMLLKLFVMLVPDEALCIKLRNL